MFDLLRGPHATLLGFGSRWQPLTDVLACRYPNLVAGHVIVGEAGHGPQVVDTLGHARAAYGDDTLFVIRPDNFVGLALDREDEHEVSSYLDRIPPEPS